MCLRTYALLLFLVAQQACVNGVVDGKIGGLVFDLQSLALRLIPQQFAVDNPNGLLPQVNLYQWVAVLSDQQDVCSDMQQHIVRKNAKQFQIAVGQVDDAGRSMNPVEDTTYKTLDIATLAFADDALPLPINTIMQGYSEGLFFVLDEQCNSPLLPEHASSGGSVTVSRYDESGLLANYNLRMGPAGDEVSGQFLAPLCTVAANRPAATCR